MSVIKFPQTEISNGLIRAKIYLPDTRKGYYRGTRFDWSGNVASLDYNGHNYFGQWFAKYEPEIHDAIMGPVEDFTPLNYLETEPRGHFIKIGVGSLLKPDDNPYTFSRLYPIWDNGQWKVRRQSDQVQFIHELNDYDYSYRYEKILHLTKGKPELVLAHTLRNMGSRTIETSVYDHNFFVMDRCPIGPGFLIRMPFKPIDEDQGLGELAEINGNEIVLIRNLGKDEAIECYRLEGFGSTAKDYDISIESHNTGAGVRITSDQPILKLAFWACSTTLCPEPYIKITLDPGKEISWKLSYNFYALFK